MNNDGQVYLVRFVQVHESFRKPELHALAAVANIKLEILEYSETSPFCIIKLRNEANARTLIHRSILSKAIYELWGSGTDYDTLHADVQQCSTPLWSRYHTSSFRFDMDSYQGKRSSASQRALIESFRYVGFRGPIVMKDPEQSFVIFEDYEFQGTTPKRLYLGRHIAPGARGTIATYDLKRRAYISTTSMDSELALVTANLTLAGPGRIFYDPFVGTGSFPIACAHFGAYVMGSDIDGRSIRGTRQRNLVSNFAQYGLTGRFLDSFVSDLTNSPLRLEGGARRLLDGITCDPPYGVREGLKVLGSRDGKGKEVVYVDGIPAHLLPTYVPPKRPYGFEAMLDDILDFAANSLIENGRISLWMPTANDEEVELGIPTQPCLELVSNCVQAFNKWSRRLLTYRRLPDSEVKEVERKAPRQDQGVGVTADELNSFRKRYFEGFKSQDSIS